MKARDFATAEELYRRLAGLFPEEPGLALNHGLALYSNKRFSAAIKELRRFLNARPGHAPAWLLVGLSFQKLGKPSEAVEPLQRALDLDRGNRVARMELADALLRSNRPGQASREFSQLVRQDSQDPKALLGLGLSYSELSSAAAEHLARSAPRSAYYQLPLARAAQAQGRFRAAYAHYRAAEEIDAGAPGIHRGVAEVYQEAGRPEWAAAELAKRDPNEPCVQRQFECWFEAGALDRILEETERATTPESLYWRARALAERAKQAHGRLLALPPSSASYRLAATIEDVAGDPREAAMAWRNAAELEPENISLRVGLLRSLSAAGHHEESIRVAEDLLRRQPGSAEGRFYHGDALLELGRVEEAIPRLEDAVRLSDGEARMRESLATAYLRAGRGAEAIPHLETALQRRDDERLWFQLSRAYQAAGRAEEARVALQRRSAAIAARPMTPAADEITAP